MRLAGPVALFLLGSAFLLVPLALALGGLLHRRPGAEGIWRRRYTVAAAVGAGYGSLLGLLLTFVLMAISWGLPAPWNVLIFPVGGTAGALAGAFVFMVPVALVHGVSCLVARGKTTVAPDE